MPRRDYDEREHGYGRSDRYDDRDQGRGRGYQGGSGSGSFRGASDQGGGESYFGGGRQFGEGFSDAGGEYGQSWRTSGGGSQGWREDNERRSRDYEDRGSRGYGGTSQQYGSQGGYSGQQGYSGSQYGSQQQYGSNRPEGEGRNWGGQAGGMYGGGMGGYTGGGYQGFDPDSYGSGYSSGRRQSGGGYSSDYPRSESGYYSDRSGSQRDRGWWDRTSDEVASWFGDEEAQRRREQDQRGEGGHRGKGPKGYARSDERIKESVSDKLEDDHYLDASNIEVDVQSGDVVLTGTVETRYAKRHAEELAERCPGVKNVENRLRVSSGTGIFSGSGSSSSGTGISSSTGTGSSYGSSELGSSATSPTSTTSSDSQTKSATNR